MVAISSGCCPVKRFKANSRSACRVHRCVAVAHRFERVVDPVQNRQQAGIEAHQLSGCHERGSGRTASLGFFEQENLACPKQIVRDRDAVPGVRCDVFRDPLRGGQRAFELLGSEFQGY